MASLLTTWKHYLYGASPKPTIPEPLQRQILSRGLSRIEDGKVYPLPDEKPVHEHPYVLRYCLMKDITDFEREPVEFIEYDGIPLWADVWYRTMMMRNPKREIVKPTNENMWNRVRPGKIPAWALRDYCVESAAGESGFDEKAHGE